MHRPAVATQNKWLGINTFLLLICGSPWTSAVTNDPYSQAKHNTTTNSNKRICKKFAAATATVKWLIDVIIYASHVLTHQRQHCDPDSRQIRDHLFTHQQLAALELRKMRQIVASNKLNLLVNRSHRYYAICWLWNDVRDAASTLHDHNIHSSWAMKRDQRTRSGPLCSPDRTQRTLFDSLTAVSRHDVGVMWTCL